MNKNLIIFILVFLLICTGLSGCEELEKLDEPNYITVTVKCTTIVEMWIGSFHDTTKDVKNILVKVEIIKDGGERVSETVATNNNGYTSVVTGTFNVYKEQSICCIANVILSSVEHYSDYTFNSEEWTLTWSQLDANYDFGDSAEWSPTLKVKGFANIY